MKKLLLASAALLVGVTLFAVARAEDKAKEKTMPAKAAVVWPAADIQWTENPALKGAKLATLWGDPKTGAYGAIKKIPAGAGLGWHTHTHDQKVVVLSGTVLFSLEGGPVKEMGNGSYLYIPGGMPHQADCKPGADCVYFEEADGASDIHFMDQKPGK